MNRRGVLLLLMLASACTRTLVDYESATYTVRAGDTLYSIAFRHGLDPERLADWNGIADPNLIRPGQRLLLRPAASRPATQAASRSVQQRAGPAPQPAQPVSASRPPSPAPLWQWPTRGPVLSRYGTGELASGIAIGGAAGQPVVAAAAGRVVYAGTGLIGYGQLVIVRHNDTYLSAYGHNRRLYVTQGDEVERGQTIAEMGLGPGQRPQLHFEIRRDGDPIDPLPFLSSAG